MTLDESLKNFKKFVTDFDSYKQIDITESDTRSKIIDKLFIETLGWEEKDISREGHVDSGYFDYKISIPGFHLIVEAKKQFVEFTIPNTRKKTSLNSLLKENEEVITQIRNYLTDSGISNGIITNGKQFIIGKFVNTDGTDWKKNQCLLFDGFQDIEKRFIEFHNNLSKESIIDNGGFAFYSEELISPSYKIVSTLIDREKEIVRNNISAEIAPLIEFVFGEIFQEEEQDNIEFFKECFISNEEIKKNRTEIERLFGDNAPDLSEVIPAKNTDSVVSQIESEIASVPIFAKETSAPKPIIIVGSKGSGKTTFINYLFKSRISEKVLSNHPYVYIDFRRYFNQDKSIDTEKIAEDVLEYLYENYSDLQLHSTNVLKRVYFREIKRNNESIWDDLLKDSSEKEYKRKLNEFFENKSKNRLEHLEFLSKYLIRERRIRLLLIFDNADQFDSKLQERVFLLANSLNRKANCGVIVSLREGYYYKWRNSPPFDAFESNVYHITAPRYNEVLQKRINYTLSKLEFAGKTSGLSSQGFKIELDNQSIYEFLFGLKNSLFSEENSQMIDFLNYSSFPNIREGLRLFKLFLVSGYTDVSEYIMRVRYSQKEKRVYIPIHEFFKTMGLNNKLYYNHETSIIPNLFYPVEGSNDHFLEIWILKYLQKQLESGGNATKYIQVSQILTFFINIGYKLSILNLSLIELLKRELIETDDLISDIEWEILSAKDFNLCLSAKGDYYLKNAKNRFHYHDLVLQDTPIFIKDYFDSIKANFPLADNKGVRILSDRLLTVKGFIKYLKEMEKSQHKELIRLFGSIVEEIISFGLEKDYKNIEEKLPPINRTLSGLQDPARSPC
jgi:Cdc6-like AAA superfamily ATPase